MQNVGHAIANLRANTGISTLDFDAGGNLSLVFDDRMEVNLHRVDDTTIELWSDLSDLGSEDDPELLRRVLEANYLGSATGAARIAIGEEGLVLCERIDVTPLDDHAFQARIIAFLRHASFWASPEAAQSVAANGGGSSSSYFDAEAVVFRG